MLHGYQSWISIPAHRGPADLKTGPAYYDRYVSICFRPSFLRTLGVGLLKTRHRRGRERLPQFENQCTTPITLTQEAPTVNDEFIPNKSAAKEKKLGDLPDTFTTPTYGQGRDYTGHQTTPHSQPRDGEAVRTYVNRCTRITISRHLITNLFHSTFAREVIPCTPIYVRLSAESARY